jgi:hypothetical protein
MGIGAFHLDHLQLGHIAHPGQAQLGHAVGFQPAPFKLQLFAQGIAHAHDHAAFHLAVEQAGLITRPASWAATIFFSPPSSSRMARWAAKP